MLGYTAQSSIVLVGSKSASGVITRGALTSAYSGNTVDFPTGGYSKMNISLSYKVGAGETSNSLEVRVRSSVERTNFYQIPNEAVSAGTSTLTQREFTINNSTKYGELDYDAQTGNFVAGLLLTGGLSSATGYIVSDTDAGTTGTLVLETISGTFQNNETITDSATGSATSNGTVSFITNFAINLDVQDEFMEVAIKETGGAVAGTVYCEVTLSGSK